ncbi:putative reverse transcriptase domain-containing protein, partial [Tanacetum coccineum]
MGELTLLGLVKRESTRDYCPCVPNATITTKGHVLPGVISARRSAIWLVTVGVLVRLRSSVPPMVYNRHAIGSRKDSQTAVNGCYECGVQGHNKKDCPKLKNGNHGNQCGNDNAPAKVYVVGNAGTNPDLR